MAWENPQVSLKPSHRLQIPGAAPDESVLASIRGYDRHDFPVKRDGRARVQQPQSFMKHNILFSLAVAAAIGISTSSSFAQDTRVELIDRISAAQGVTDMFEQQIAQQQKSLQGYGAKLINDAVIQNGGQPSDQDKAVFERFVGRAARIFTAKELSAKWVENYGARLSTDDLREILKYYESPVGKRDAAANQAAMAAFSEWMANEAQTRTTALVSELLKELQQIRR